MAVCLTAVSGVNAQIRISINANIVSQPVWGPTGYDYARYYYLPDIDAYYSIPNIRLCIWKVAIGFLVNRCPTGFITIYTMATK